MFYEDGNGCNTFAEPQGHTQCVLVSYAECNQKTPQGTFKVVQKTLEFALMKPFGLSDGKKSRDYTPKKLVRLVVIYLTCVLGSPCTYKNNIAFFLMLGDL